MFYCRDLGELCVYCSPSLFAIAVLLIVSYPFQRFVSVVSIFIYFCYNLCLGICTYSQSVYNIFLSLLITQNWLYCKQHQHNGRFLSHCHYSKTVSLGLATLKQLNKKSCQPLHCMAVFIVYSTGLVMETLTLHPITPCLRILKNIKTKFRDIYFFIVQINSWQLNWILKAWHSSWMQPHFF